MARIKVYFRNRKDTEVFRVIWSVGINSMLDFDCFEQLLPDHAAYARDFCRYLVRRHVLRPWHVRVDALDLRLPVHHVRDGQLGHVLLVAGDKWDAFFAEAVKRGVIEEE